MLFFHGDVKAQGMLEDALHKSVQSAAHNKSGKRPLSRNANRAYSLC